jgi:hypothetical protein
MTVVRFAHKISLVFACLLVFALTSASSPALAQKDLWNKTKEGVQKGAEGVKKGAETVGEKTKEGAETVGRETKEFVTGEKQSEGTTTKPSETTTRSTTTTRPSEPATSTRSSSTRSTHPSKSTSRELPKTAGDISLLGVAGALAFAGAGLSKLLRGTAK